MSKYRVALARVHLGSGDLVAAERALEGVGTSDIDAALIREEIGLVRGQAVSTADTLRELDNGGRTTRALALLNFNNGRLEHCVTQCLEELQKNPDDHSLRRLLASAYRRLGQNEKCRGELKTIYFGYDKDELTDAARSILRQNANWLKANPQWNVVLEGHCDERGTIEYNLALGQRRANSVRSYMASLGVDASRVRTVSYGEERPADNGHNEAAWAKNRRAESKVEDR